jgi:phospholipid/cholesterol/gamma-HCH transport system substrate-binding protein
MPRTRSLAWSELKIGVVTIAAIVITAATIFLLTGGRGFFWQRYNLKTRFGNVAGLKEGSPVRVAGIEYGTVTDVVLVGEQVDVVFELNKDLRDRITTNSVARLGSVSLLGESAVDISPSSAGTPIPDWGYVPQGPAPTMLADVTDQAGRGITELTGLITDLRAGRGSVGKLLTDDQLYVGLNQFVASASQLTRSIQDGNGTLGKLISDPAAANALTASLKNVEEMTRQLNEGNGSLGALLKDDRFSKSLTAATTNLDALVSKISTGEGTAGKLINDPALFNQMSSLTARLDQLIANLNAGDGTAGRLLKDRQLYENIDGAVNDVRSLIEAIKKDPRRYLNVRISIF